MTPHTRNQLLLHEICDLIPDPDTAALIRSMDPYDHITFAEAYCAVRTLPTLTRDLRRRLLAEITALVDIEQGHLPEDEEAHRSRTRVHATPPSTASA